MTPLRITAAFVLGCAAIFAAAPTADAALKMPAVFSDHMVLQRDHPLPVWGWGEPGETVSIRLAEAEVAATADAAGRWRATLPKKSASTAPLTLTVRGSSTLTFSDVLIGEVWLCAGQSNMEMSLGNTEGGAAAITEADRPMIRLLQIPRKTSLVPEPDVAASWTVCSPTTIKQGHSGGFSAVAYHFARELQPKLGVPIGLIESAWGGTRLDPWTPPEGFAAVPALADISAKVQQNLASLRDTPRDPSAPGPDNRTPASVYHAMVHPLVPFAIRGALWYQGEANVAEGSVAQAPLYTEKMRALIGGWRSVWQQGDFPFLFVQLAPYAYRGQAPDILPAFWEAQTQALQIPHTGMAVINDLADKLDDPHPRNKHEVGRRLALLARKHVYGERELVATGPVFRSLRVDGARLRIRFDAIGGGLASRDGQPLSHFEIRGAEPQSFMPATAVIEGDEVVLSAPEVAAPVAMRFAWHKFAQPNLINKEGLPAGAFRASSEPEPLD